MKNLIMASVIALTATLPFATTSSAATMKVMTVERIDHRPGDKMMDRRHHRADCMIQKVKTRHHGRTIVKVTKVCR